MFPLENEYKSLLPRNAHWTYKAACTKFLASNFQILAAEAFMFIRIFFLSLISFKAINTFGTKSMSQCQKKKKKKIVKLKRKPI